MSSIASRASWGAKHRDGVGNRPVGRLERYFHHTVTTHLTATATIAQERAQMRAIEQIGQSRFGAGISYNFIVFPSGRIYQGASVDRIAYHSGPGRNVRGAAICLAGNYEDNLMTNAQISAVAWLIRRGIQRGWWTSAGRLIPHRSFSSTACSGRHSIAQIPAIERIAATGGGSTPARPTQEDSMFTLAQIGKAASDAVWGRRFQAVNVGTDYALPAQDAANRFRLIGDRASRALVLGRRNAAELAGLRAAVGELAKAGGVDPATIERVVRESTQTALQDVSITLSVAGDEQDGEA